MNLPEVPEEGPGPDVRLLESALHLIGLCDRFELAEILGWSLTRLERTLEHLQARLDGTAVCLVRLGREVQLAVREQQIPHETLTLLIRRGQMRTGLAVAEASRALDLIRERLTDPDSSKLADTITPQDADLLERGVLVLDAMTAHAGPSLAAHPDLFFALGFCPAPVAEAVPRRPDPPSLPPPDDLWAGSGDGGHVAISFDDEQAQPPPPPRGAAHPAPGAGATTSGDLPDAPGP